MLREARLDSIRIALAQLLCPGAVAGVELARCVSLDPPRELLQLDPQQTAPFGRPRGVDRQRLANDHRRRGREQTTLGFVHGA